MRRIAAIIFFLWILCLNVSLAQNSKSDSQRLSQAYGYFQGQQMTLDKIEKKYPDLKNSIKKAEIEFKLSFGRAQHNITAKLREMLGSNFNEYQLKSKEQLKKYLRNQKISKDLAIGFINKVNNRANGEIQSPVLETLLIYQFIDSPSEEFNRGFTTKYSTKRHPKAKGLNIGIEIPKSWSNKETERPNIVQKFTSSRGKGKASIQIIVKDLPFATSHQLTKKEINDFYNEETMKTMLPENSNFISSKKIVIDNYPGGQIQSDAKVKRLDLIVRIRSIMYSTIYNNKLVLVQAAVANVGDKNLDVKFNQFYPLFRQIANSIVLLDQY